MLEEDCGYEELILLEYWSAYTILSSQVNLLLA